MDSVHRGSKYSSALCKVCIVYVRMYIYIYVCMYVCMHVCIYIYIYICMSCKGGTFEKVGSSSCKPGFESLV